MNKYMLILLLLIGCTHGNISDIPIHVNGVGDVYRYEGRANLAHQTNKAYTMIKNHCKKLNGGTPVILNTNKHDIGFIIVGNAIMKNYNQDILYTCKIKEQAVFQKN